MCCAVTIAASLAAVPRVSAQDFFEIVDVPLVEVDVAVTDAQGRPVDDLSQDAFTLLVDGEEQEISFFASPSGIDLGGTNETGSLPAHLVILFDNNSVERQNRNVIIEDFREYLLEDPNEFQQIMVATLSQAGLEIQQEFTNDPARTDAALERVAGTVARDASVAEYEALLMDIQKLAGARDPTLRDSVSQTSTLVSRIIGFSDRARQDAAQVVSHIWELTQGLDGLPGRRSIVYVGGAVSVSPGESLLTALKGVLDRSGDGWANQASSNLPAGVAAGGGREIDSLSLAASLNGVAVYSVMVGGGAQVISTGSSASSITAKDSSGMDSSGSWSPGFDSRIRNESRSGLDKLAVATGGFVHASIGRTGPALEQIVDQMSLRYVLGFHPLGGADGQPHEIDIRVDGAGLRVRHRESFRARSWDAETTARLRSVLLHGGGENRHQVEIEARPAEKSADGAMRVPLTVRVPLSSLAIEPIRDNHRGQISVFATGSGAKRFATASVRKSVLPVVLPNDDLQGAMGQMAEYRLDLEVPENARELAVAVRDDLSTELSVVRMAVPKDEPVLVQATVAPALDRASLNESSVPVRLPSAALLMSGQQGGRIQVESDEKAGSDPDRPGAIGVVAKLQGEQLSETLLALEIHIYMLDSAGQPVARSSRRVTVDSPAQDEMVDIPIELPTGSLSLSVLIRDLQTNEFGLARIMVAERENASPRVELRIAALETVSSEEPIVGRTPDGTGSPTEKRRVSLQEISLGLFEVLEIAASGRASAAQSRLRDLEIEATSGRSPMAIVDLGKREAKVVATMADGSWERLLPLALLWGELIDDYRRRRLGPLSEHAMAMSTQLGSNMARQADTLATRAEASDLLVSLSGYLLYSQRLGRTEELLELAIKVDEKNEAALLALAATREQLGDYEGALDVLMRLHDLAPESAEGQLRMAVNLLRTERPAEADPMLRSLIAQEDQDWISKIATQELARSLAAGGHSAEAVSVLEHAAERWPDEPAMQIQLAWLLDQAGSSDQASEWVLRVAKGTHPAADSPRFRYHRWYLEGLANVRARLSEKSEERATEAIEAYTEDAIATGGS